ncbi:hypothetical protein [Geothrix sp. PMB-07]|uniref:hypothetical protein n=1 Tax=Geothrix sp. PMB-07 TaxID=3068640 RepID=UPI002740EE17|nr:hypothetical protein [Geothrix sp. PMB-07]WLT30069.1 hypothetical protein Q9293_10105 [Geothrix sp. PMB-07]
MESLSSNSSSNSTVTSEFAEFVFQRAQRSGYLLESLRHALADLGRPDLIAILDLVNQDTFKIMETSRGLQEECIRFQTLETLVDLQKMAKLGGPRARPFASRIAQRITA